MENYEPGYQEYSSIAYKGGQIIGGRQIPNHELVIPDARPPVTLSSHCRICLVKFYPYPCLKFLQNICYSLRLQTSIENENGNEKY